MRFRIVPALLALFLLVASGADANLSKLDPLARRALSQLRAGESPAKLRATRASVNSARQLDVFITGSASRAALEAAGARIRTELAGIVTAYVPETAIERVAALPGVTGIRGASRVKKLLDQSVPTTAANLQRGVAPSFDGANGAGVIVGMVDTGVDFDHGDFENPDGTTRVLSLWDQMDLDGPSPATYGYGSEWFPADLNNHTARAIDDDGHGTHVLGIAAGDGSQTGGTVSAFTYVGMAPKADLVVVRTDYSDTGILDGVAYVMDRATALGKNAVVNLSLGSLYGPKDGTSPFEAGIAALTGPGRIVVAAAGNDGNYPVHANVTAGPGGTSTVTFTVPSSSDGSVVAIDGYYLASGTQSVKVVTPGGTTIGPVAQGDSNDDYPGTSTSRGDVYLENGAFVTATGDHQVYLEINVGSGQSATGTWTMTFANGSGSSGSVEDETTENLAGAPWSTATATPGTSSGAVTGTQLLISEVGMRGVNSATQTDSTEFLEIRNPTGSAIDLSNYYLSDVNGYAQLPAAGTVDLASSTTDFAMKFPAGATIAAGATKVIAVDGGRWKRARGTDADFMLFNAGGATSAVKLTDVGANKPGGYPGFGSFTNAAEFVWLFRWDGATDLVCDVDFVSWGSGSGGNAPALKSGSLCVDGPDAGSTTSCYGSDGGGGSALPVPASGSGTRQRVAAEGAESSGGNSCLTGPPVVGDPVETDLWIFFDTEGSLFVAGADPTHKLVSEPACAEDVVSVGAWVTRTSWVDCGARAVSYLETNPVGDIADFSSMGPTRDGRQKPDLVAPGMGIGSATSFDIAQPCPASPSGLLQDDAQHQIFEGTSMSAPHVTGAVALLLQKHGALTPSQVRSMLAENAVTDAFTGTTWNRFWGAGKLRVPDLTDPTVAVTAPNGGEVYPVGASRNLTWNAQDPYLGVTTLDLELSRNGGTSWEPIVSGIANSGTYAWTVSGPATALARVRVTARDAAGNDAADPSDAPFAIVPALDVPEGEDVRAFALSIASGNPSAGNAEIAFALPYAADVRVEVYDVSGRLAASLARGSHPAGRHTVRWSGANGPRGARSGVYFVRLRAAGHEITKRFVLTP